MESYHPALESRSAQVDPYWIDAAVVLPDAVAGFDLGVLFDGYPGEVSVFQAVENSEGLRTGQIQSVGS